VIRILLASAVLCSAVALGAGEAPPVPTPPAVVSPAAKPFLGVNVDEAAASFDPAQGLPVTVVIPGSTAATLGIQAGDLLQSFNGKPLRSQADLAAALGATKVGDNVTIELARKQGDKSEKKTVSGAISERPQVRTLNTDLAKLREEVVQLRAKAEEKKQQEISLAEILKQLKEIEQNLPAAVAEFKKQYPNGDFNISIKIDITSDRTAKKPIEVGNQPQADVKAEDPKDPKAPKAPAPAP
jgi:membrane-associated protease RseP (regulator of RpoE activity)